MMQDHCQRVIRYLRLSLTSGCSMRCTYCRPAMMGADSAAAALSADRIEQMVRHLVEKHGLQKVRLTGGEPTMRPDLIEIIRRLRAIDGLQDLAMTTNGLTLVRDADALAAAGLSRVNISLDSIDPGKFERITGVNGLNRVLAGIDRCRQVGLSPVKINTVVVRRQNDKELAKLLLFAAARNIELRFIELMPMGPLAASWSSRFVSADEMQANLAEVVHDWDVLPRTPSAARMYEAHLVGGGRARVGFITAMSCPFCDACDRIRIGADGQYYPCLMDHPAGSVLPAFEPSFDGDRFDAIIRGGLETKEFTHPSVGTAIMSEVGG